jgi:hypothetical protein
MLLWEDLTLTIDLEGCIGVEIFTWLPVLSIRSMSRARNRSNSYPRRVFQEFAVILTTTFDIEELHVGLAGKTVQ